MPWIQIVTVALHAVPAVFWAGSSFVLARGALSPQASLGLRKSQLGAAGVTMLIGAILWGETHAHAFGRPETVLALGALSAIIAAGLQGAVGMRAAKSLAAGQAAPADAGRLAVADRLSAALLALTILCMVTAKYF